MAKLLSTKDVAERLDVSVSTVLKWCQRGLLDAHKVGSGRRGVWVIPEDVLDDFERPPMGRPPEREDNDE